MEWYHLVMIGAAVVAAALAWNVPRAVLWIVAGAISYVTSAWWHTAGLPGATYYGAATNLVICYLLWIFAQRRYESLELLSPDDHHRSAVPYRRNS